MPIDESQVLARFEIHHCRGEFYITKRLFTLEQFFSDEANSCEIDGCTTRTTLQVRLYEELYVDGVHTSVCLQQVELCFVHVETGLQALFQMLDDPEFHQKFKVKKIEHHGVEYKIYHESKKPNRPLFYALHAGHFWRMLPEERHALYLQQLHDQKEKKRKAQELRRQEQAARRIEREHQLLEYIRQEVSEVSNNLGIIIQELSKPDDRLVFYQVIRPDKLQLTIAFVPTRAKWCWRERYPSTHFDKVFWLSDRQQVKKIVAKAFTFQ